MALEKIAQHTAKLFTQCFGRPPQWIVAAPGRVNLMGEHTDYNDGFVLPMAVEKLTVIAAARSPRREVVIHSGTTGDTATINLRAPIQRDTPAWADYVRGVIVGIQAQKVNVPGFNAMVNSSVPMGAGLSSSAALEVASATLLAAMTGLHLPPAEMARLCQKAEHEFAGMPCGIMDQFTSLMAKSGHLLLLDCRSLTTRAVPMTDPAVSVLIVDTNVRHKLTDGDYGQRRKECATAARSLGVNSLRDVDASMLATRQETLDPVILRRARHVVTENQRTLDIAAAIEAADWRTAGQIMYASHSSLRDDFAVSCPELDLVVEIAQSLGESSGVFGCRMTGGGFGGCAVALVRTDAIQPISRRISQAYEAKTGIHPHIFSSRPAAGARVLNEPGPKTGTSQIAKRTPAQQTV